MIIGGRQNQYTALKINKGEFNGLFAQVIQYFRFAILVQKHHELTSLTTPSPCVRKL